MKKKTKKPISVNTYQAGGLLSLLPNLDQYQGLTNKWNNYWKTGTGVDLNNLQSINYDAEKANYNRYKSNIVVPGEFPTWNTDSYQAYTKHLYNQSDAAKQYGDFDTLTPNQQKEVFDDHEVELKGWNNDVKLPELKGAKDLYIKDQFNNNLANLSQFKYQNAAKSDLTNVGAGIFTGLNYLNAYKPPETLYETNGSKGYMQLGGSSNKLLTGSNKLFDLLNKYKVIDSTNVSREDFNKYSIDLQKEYFNKLPSTPKPKGEVIYTETRPVIATIDKETKKQDFTSAYAAAKKQGLKYFDFDKGDGRGVQKYKIEDSKTPVIRPSESGSIQGRKDSVTNTLSNFQSGGNVNNLLTGSNQLYDLLNKHSVLNNTSMSRDSFNTLPLDVQKEYFSKLPSTPRPKGEVIYSESRPVEFTVNDNIIPTNTEPNTSKETFGEAYSKAKRNKSKYFNFDKGDGKGVKKYKVEDKVDDSDFIEFGDFVSKNKMAFKKTLTKFKQQDGGLVNTTGYTPGTNTFNNPINIIPGNSITSKPMPDNFNISAQPIYKEGLGKSFLYNNTMSDVNDNKAIGFLEKKLPYYKNGGIVEGDYNIDDISQLSNTELKRLRDMGYKIEFI